ncbi:sensor histidine kinase [Heyndrickxia ginsengihumi]|uniref:histidine kinase n=1 Tax=Heyndrickxia ginsengihumi TaxID=363870 RepID=A0A6M0PCQ4_9BACI|nr:histidine kinase [Heyndrickxia ginsengihumi]MBE6184506.1 two-component sensor histidine kinase [Bacillus sp. (in: firmicutes)]MCM3024780.1 histidine kinase [Heyndrickxia ginsengihumi]NEY21468.1 two-component sensor histidine kinase [Heyndrickxia ginsengihumi]
MKYRQIKWLILIIPTIAIGLWEYIRHVFLLPYISMTVGNFLSPIIIFAVTLIFLLRLFSILEKIQDELKHEKAKKAALIEREILARELHDGIAQSLFLLSVKVNKFGRKRKLENQEDFQAIKQTIQHIHEDIRQSITNLTYSSNEESYSWTKTIYQSLMEIRNNHSLEMDLQWEIPETRLSSKEKIELFACIKEAVMNVIKHAKTNKIWIEAKETGNGWTCTIKDNGIGFTDKEIQSSKGYGLQIIKKRAKEMEWEFSINRMDHETIVEISKEC